MAAKYAVLQRIENGDQITEEFQFLIYRALLLALQEQGSLGISEYRKSEELLMRRRQRPEKGVL